VPNATDLVRYIISSSLISLTRGKGLYVKIINLDLSFHCMVICDEIIFVTVARDGDIPSKIGERVIVVSNTDLNLVASHSISFSGSDVALHCLLPKIATTGNKNGKKLESWRRRQSISGTDAELTD
jgi:hypothetical protein